jgi:plastocyanin
VVLTAPRALLIGAVLLFDAIGAQDPSAGDLFGRVEVRLGESAADRRPGVAELGSPKTRSQAERRRAVVYLETAPSGAFEDRGSRRARMDQRNETFVPHVLAITTGTIVDFPNNDATFHNVFSLSRPRPFDLGRYASGKSKSVQFDRPGIVRVFCDIHSHMNAYILVFSHRFFAVTDHLGRYRIDDIPPGTYSVAVWNEATRAMPRTVTVAAGAEVELNFTTTRAQGGR